MPHIKYLIIFLSLFSVSKILGKQQNHVFLCYGKVPVEKIINFKYVILEAIHYTPSEVALIKQQNDIVLCYISLGEFNKYTSFYKDAEKFKLEGKNTTWNSFYLDLSKSELQNIILNDIQQKILHKGFDGLFLDNIDNYGTYGKQRLLQPHLLTLLKNIKHTFPSIHLMQNAGLEILDKTHELISSVAIESIITNYDFKNKEYKFRAKDDFKTRFCNLKSIQEKYPLPFILIEYTNSKRYKRKIARKLQKRNWYLFIGQIDLQKTPSFK